MFSCVGKLKTPMRFESNIAKYIIMTFDFEVSNINWKVFYFLFLLFKIFLIYAQIFKQCFKN